MRTRTLLALVPAFALLAACEQPVTSLGHDLSSLFPAAGDHYWRYTNDGRTDLTYWVAQGQTTPGDEALTTYRLWVGADSAIRDDYQGDRSEWAVDLFFASRGDGWYFAGWDANPEGPSPGFGTNVFEGDGVPIAVSNVAIGMTIDSSAGGSDWTTTFVDEENGPFEFNGQSYTEAWHVNIASSAGNTPFEGDYWLKGGPGIIQYDVVGYRPATGEAWTHFHNDSTATLFVGSN